MFMKITPKTGFVSLLITSISMCLFIDLYNAGSSLITIPIASILILSLSIAVLSIYLNLESHVSGHKYFNSRNIFIIGSGLSALLLVIILLCLPMEMISGSDELHRKSIYLMLKELLDITSEAHWFIHLLLGLALLSFFSTIVGLFITTDSLGAINASLISPIFGIIFVVLAFFAIYAFIYVVFFGFIIFLVILSFLVRLNEE